MAPGAVTRTSRLLLHHGEWYILVSQRADGRLHCHAAGGLRASVLTAPRWAKADGLVTLEEDFHSLTLVRRPNDPDL
jgi:hypothetical protein